MALWVAFIQGFLFSLSLCLDLGMVNVSIIKTGVERGFKPSFMIGFGSCFGDLTYLALALIGFSFILEITVVRWILWIAGTAVLLLLAYKMAKESLHPKMIDWNAREGSGAVKQKSRLADFLFGLGAALSSPTVMLWFVASAGPIVAEVHGDSRYTIAVFIAGFFTAGLLWSLGMAFLSGRAGKALGAKFVRVISLLSALLFVYFAIRVFWSGLQDVLG
ncbi:L-lysine exporter family protein LysE/ArgO [Paenibacillus catalpae]|uniref:L-lysine exporter family protein LysE/ArgO n=1 Tax=Paenibacillus catalpae TaxID=1045775 RepID=A0A1I2F2Z7_9BACL|nr:LysE family transporter [Paenibacillus catalpae]SFE99197.1 L-lysine exporter family protein LysE/ArgO [Paenibacillus catalpae]